MQNGIKGEAGQAQRERERERVTEVALCLCKDLWVNKSPLVCVTPPQRHYLLCHGDMSVSRVCR